ncbi:MAG: glycosyltransferase family 2 protein, partial [Ornithinimicrobium sp.]
MSDQPREPAPPDITVVIATRDRPELMREALEAVRAQQHEAVVRTILVFDQSQPDLSLVDEDPLRPVDVVRNHRREGLAGARNTGIELATTPLVAFCDDDDVWLPGRLAPQVSALASAPRSVLATTGIRVEQGGRVHDRVLEQTEVHLLDLLADRHTELHPSTFLMRREAVVRLGMVEEDVPGGFGEDYDLLIRCAREAPVLHVPDPLVRIRWGNQSYFTRRWETMAEGLSWMLERHPEFEESPRGSARIRGQVAFAHAALGHRR